MCESTLRLRVFGPDGISPGSVVRGSRILQLFTDAITEILVRNAHRLDRVETMDAQFPSVVLSGEYIEVKVVRVGCDDGSWHLQCIAHKVVALRSDNKGFLALSSPELIATATAIAHVIHEPISTQSPAKVINIRRQDKVRR